jgi:hypothetical protein
MELSPETLIYIQSVRDYFKKNQQASDYFLTDNNEELFFQYLTEIAEKNYKSFNNPTLNRNQFELLRKTTMALSVVDKPRKVEDMDPEEFSNGIFVELIPNFGSICLN